MADHPDRRYRIGEVAEKLDVPVHLLRQWQQKFPQLKPRRDRANRRYYSASDIDIARRIKALVRHEKMTIEGARVRLSQELHGEGRPRTNEEALQLAREIEAEASAILEIIDPSPNRA